MTREADERQIWQIAAGDAGRSYVDVFLNHCVALIGPGDPGPWNPDNDRTPNSKVGGWVRWFATDVRVRRHDGATNGAIHGPRDWLWLNRSMSTFHNLATSMDGTCNMAGAVRWHRLPEPHKFDEPVFTSPKRLSRIQKTEVLEFANTTLNMLPPGLEFR